MGGYKERRREGEEKIYIVRWIVRVNPHNPTRLYTSESYARMQAPRVRKLGGPAPSRSPRSESVPVRPSIPTILSPERTGVNTRGGGYKERRREGEERDVYS